jgi:hypothetical protein
VQLLTQAATLVKLRPSAGSAPKAAPAPLQPAVLISSKPEAQREIDVALKRGSADDVQSLEMLVGEETYVLRPQDTVERGSDYEVVRFKVMRAVH